MLVTQQCDTVRSIWSSSKLVAFHQNPASPRMSSREQLKTQQDWREQYSQYIPPNNSTLLPSHFGQVTQFNGIDNSSAEQHFVVRPQLGHRHSLAQLDNRQDVSQAVIADRTDFSSRNFEQQASNGIGQDSVNPTESTVQLLTSIPLGSTSPSAKLRPDESAIQEGDWKSIDTKEGDEEEEDDDDEMLDVEDGGGPPQTEAERRAERRKMKRFRLTHQQTRFLMSEFAKQAHPDAAHRERLSREIPGLSPRQVQVWFQNRRAKIKRLTADDRDRMLKMRAVPDDFDNVQALHSPYGAVQGLGTPLHSPVDYTSTYSDQTMMRPLLVDTMRRHENDEHLSPTGISPAFGHVGFAPPGSIGTSDVLSPLSLNSGDRYYGSHQSSPLSAGPRSTNNFNRQSSSDSYQMQSSSRHPRPLQPLQPLQFRETMSRTRSQSLQSPLRTSMSWKGDSLDYADYAAGVVSPTITRRQPSHYQAEHGGSNTGGAHQYETNTYSNSNVHAHASPTDDSYSAIQPAPLLSPANTVPRYRSTSSAFSSGLDLRNQYRSLNNQQMGPPGATPPTPHRSNFSSSFANNSTGFSSAPLSAPSDFQLPRTANDIELRHYHMSQLSAPMAPPQDFRNAYNQIISPVRPAQTEGGPQNQQPPTDSTESTIQAQPADTSGFLTTDNNEVQPDHRRKRTYSMPLQFDGL